MKLLIAALVLCLASAAAFAQSAGTQPGNPATSARTERLIEQLEARFASANTSRDGKLTREQAAAGMPMVAQHFDEIDAQKLGYVTLPQIESFVKQRTATR